MSYKAGFVALIGQPNAGKSSIINSLVGEKVGIVTAKPQTTRKSVVGIFSDEEAQVLFVDQPGLVRADRGLNAFLQQEVEKGIEEADVLIAALNIDEDDPKKLEETIEAVSAQKKPWVALITKVDIPKKRHRIAIIEGMLSERGVPILKVSETWGQQKCREIILPEIKKILPESAAPLMDVENYTSQNLRDLCSEIIREKCFEFLHQEIPYNLAIQIRKYIEDEGPTVKIYADIVLAKENHRVIVLGKSGSGIKNIGMSARIEIEKMLGRKVFLNLFVRIKKNWVSNKQDLEELGYVHAQ